MSAGNRQRQLGGLDHDSLQYHFFCPGLMGGCRLFRTNSLEHASLWLADGDGTREIVSSAGPLLTADREWLDVSTDAISFRDDDGVIVITFGDSADGPENTIRMRRKTELRWGDTISEVLHLPDMSVEIDLDGSTHTGLGYCKSYGWMPAPRHWGYRFVQGFASDGSLAVWTAEATFGTGKYDYFCLLRSDGTLIRAHPDKSGHRNDSVFAITDEGPCSLALEELGVWETQLQSPGMDSLMRQRACRLTLAMGDVEITGQAINETCYGTLG